MLENVHYCHSMSHIVGGALRQTSRSGERVYRIRNEIIQCSCSEIEVLARNLQNGVTRKTGPTSAKSRKIKCEENSSLVE